MTILITGAAGRTSGYVIQALLQGSPPMDPANLRLLVRSDESIPKVQAKFPAVPRTSFVIGDYLERSTLGPALQGVDLVFHNGPAFHQLETAMGIALVDAAKVAGVKHFVYCSVLHPVLSKLLNHDCKAKIEEYLIESSLSYTILEPSSFMQNMNVKASVSSGILHCAYDPTTLQGFLDLRDLAAVARLVILDPESHNRARYELVGQNSTLEDVAATITRVAGLSADVRCQLIPRSDVVAKGTVHIRPEGAYAVDALERMLFYYDKRGIPGNSNTIRWLLGREATSWEGVIRRELSA